MKTFRILTVLLILSGTVLTGQIPDRRSNTQFMQALEAQRQGDLEKAADLYRDLLKTDPANNNYFLHVKGIYITRREFGKLDTLFSAWLKLRPTDTMVRIEQGWLLWVTGKESAAENLWYDILNRSGQKEQLSRTIFQTILAYGGPEPEKALYWLRQINRQPVLLHSEYIAYLITLQNDTALTAEIIFYLKQNPTAAYPDVNALYKLDGSDPAIITLLDYLDTMSVNSAASGLYLDLLFHSGNYGRLAETAINRSRSGVLDSRTLLTLAQHLSEAEQFTASETVCHHLLTLPMTPENLASTLFLLGQNYEWRFRSARPRTQLIPPPFDSRLTRIEFQPYDPADAPVLNKALASYDSLIALYPSRSSDARFRIGEIRYNILNDFDAALGDYQAALKLAPESERMKLLYRIVDVHIARGDAAAAREFITAAPAKYALSATEEDELSLKALQMNYLLGETDSLQSAVNVTMALLGEYHELANDLLNFSALSKELGTDAHRADIFLQAENLIHQNKLNDALKTLQDLMVPGQELCPLAAIRSIELMRILDSRAAEKSFWAAYRTALNDSPFADYFAVAYGEYLEWNGDAAGAADQYTQFLVDFSQSAWYETVRLHLRQLLALR